MASFNYVHIHNADQGTVKLYFNHTGPLDTVPVCSLMRSPTRSKYCGQLELSTHNTG